MTRYDASYYYNDGALWDHTGNPLSKTEYFWGSGAYRTTYRYDNLYRLAEEELVDPGSTTVYDLAYGYDAVGNRTSETRDGQALSFTYDDNNKLTYIEATSPTASATMQYDDAGNMTGVSGTLYQNKTMVFNDDDRVTSIAYGAVTDTYTYNWEGLRTRARLNGVYHRYLYNGERVLQDLNDDGDWHTTYTTENGSYEGMLLGLRRYDLENERFPVYDEIGSARGLVCELGTLTDSYDLDTFGTELASTGTTPNPYRYGAAWGYITDPSGLQQLGARYYWPEVGRFVSQDPEIDGEKWYAYADDNPVIKADPSGMIHPAVIVAGLALYAGSCARHSFNVAERILMDTGNDKLAHCVGVCAGARCMGIGFGLAGVAATYAGWYIKERGDTPFDPADIRANKTGIGCALSFWTWSCMKCCKKRLTSLK